MVHVLNCFIFLPICVVGPSDSIAHSPLDLGTFKQSSQKGILSTGKPHISNRITNRQNGISTGARGNDIYIYSDLMGSNENKSGSPKSRKKEISESEKMAFAMKLIIGSSSLELILREHEKDEKGKEEYNKLIKQAEDNEKTKFMNLYALKDNEKISSISSSHIVVTHAPYKPQFFFHLYLKYTTFPSLLVLLLS